MTNPIESALTQALTSFASQALAEMLSNPEALNQTLKSLFSHGHHTAEDVAQDALDALEAGNLTKKQALSIIATCLESEPTPVNTVAKRVDLPLFVRN